MLLTFFFVSCENKVPITPSNVRTYLTFESVSPFTVEPSLKWDGTLQYCNSNKGWQTLDKTSANSIPAIEEKDGKYRLYFRGRNNTVISNDYAWKLTSATNIGIDCFGNIETLLDYEKVSKGEHPTMGDSCYASMFSSCSKLAEITCLVTTFQWNKAFNNWLNGVAEKGTFYKNKDADDDVIKFNIPKNWNILPAPTCTK